MRRRRRGVPARQRDASRGAAVDDARRRRRQPPGGFVRVPRDVSPSVVQIETREGLGSGIVFDGTGDIVTNAHVVGSAKTLRVTTSAGKTLGARVVGVFAQ